MQYLNDLNNPSTVRTLYKFYLSYGKPETKKKDIFIKLTRAVVAKSTKNEDKHKCEHIFLKSGSNKNKINTKNIFKKNFKNVA
jgi:hypothetical protein